MIPTRISLFIHNYKSLRHVELGAKGFQVLMGANASGKSNLADALDFLSDVYTHGLEAAVARKGGYENICFRRKRRSKAPIEFQLKTRVRLARALVPGYFDIRHKFGFKTKSESIQADFEVVSEELSVDYTESSRRQVASSIPRGDSRTRRLISLVRPGDKEQVDLEIGDPVGIRLLDVPMDRLRRWQGGLDPGETELAASLLSRLFAPLRRFFETMGGIRVFQLSPYLCREPGVPTPNPELDRHGANLPAVVNYLQHRHADTYDKILVKLKEIVPTVEEIQVKYTHRRTVTIDFSEEGAGRPWVIEEMSDGTVQVLALLVGVLDPRNSLVVIEEPENSVHPWILRSLVKVVRNESTRKQFLATSHSPILLNMLNPGELLIVSKAEGETRIRKAETLEESLPVLWERGQMTLFDLLDSGLIREAVPIFEPPEVAE